jgi:hypothetical protein
MVWVTHALTFLAGGTIGAACMACVVINRVEQDFDRDPWDSPDLGRRDGDHGGGGRPVD